MIVDMIDQKVRYLGISEEMYAALEFIESCRVKGVPADGQYEILPERVTAFVVSLETVADQSANYEVHRNDMDIHYIVSGCESFGYAPVFRQEGLYDPEKDIAFGAVEESASFHLTPGMFAALWPGEAHRPLGAPQGISGEIRKIICKVRPPKDSI